MNIKVCVILLAVAVSSANAQMQPPPGKDGHQQNFAERKQAELSHIAKHLQIVQTQQSCVNAASDMQALHTCNQQAHAALEANRPQH